MGVLFAGLRLFMVPGVPAKAKDLAGFEGAKVVNSVLDDPSHVISDSWDAPEVTEAKDCFGAQVLIVKSTWIELSVKTGRLLPVRAFSPEPKQLFKGLRICVSQIPSHDSVVLWAAVECYGGYCLKDLDRDVTHLVCGRASGSKYLSAMEENKVSIITPDWITDCIRDQILQPIESYHPKFLVVPEPPPSSSPNQNDESDESLLTSLLHSDLPELMHAEFSNAPNGTALVPGMEANSAAGSHEADVRKLLGAQENAINRPPGGPGYVTDMMNQNKLLMAQQASAALVRPQTKTALARFLNTRLTSSNTQDSVSNNMQGGTMMQGHHQISPQPHPLIPMPPQMPEPSQIQANQQQQHWQWKQQQSQFVGNPNMQQMVNIPVSQQQQQNFQQMQMAGHQQHHQQMQQQPQQHQQIYQMQQNPQMQFVPQSNQFSMPMQNMQIHNQQQQQIQMPQQRPQIPMQQHPQQQQQQIVYQTQMQIRQPPPYQQVVQRPTQIQMIANQNHMVQQNHQFVHVNQNQVAPQMMDGSGMEMGNVLMQHQQPGQQQVFQQQNHVQNVRPLMDNSQLVQQMPQQVPRPALQTQVSVERPPAPVRLNSTTEPVYVGFDCAHVPPMKFLVGCKIVLPITKDVAGVENKALKNCEMVIKKYGGQIVPPESLVTTATHVICDSQLNPVAQAGLKAGKRVVSMYWLNDCYRKGEMRPPWRLAHIPCPFGDGDRPLKGKIATVTGFHDDEREDVIALLLTLGARYQPFLDREVFVMICKATGAKKFAKAMEWGVPAVNADWLHDLWHRDAKPLTVLGKDPRYVFFNYDAPIDIGPKKLPANIMAAWTTPIVIPSEIQSKFNGNTKGRPLNPQNHKKRIKKQMMENECKKKRKLGPVVILFDGVEKSEENKLTKGLKGLAASPVSITEKYHVCTHLVTHRVVRTPKWLIAFNCCRYVVQPKWIADSVEAGRLLEPDEFLPTDFDGEQKDNFLLRESLERKQALLQAGAQLFSNVHFFISPRVYPQPDTLAEIIDSAGGKVIKHRMPKLEELKSHGRNGVYFVVIASVSDSKDLAGLIKTGHPLYSAEFVFSAIIKQRIDWGSNRLDFSQA